MDEETVLYDFTIDDPTTYTEPWGGEAGLAQLEIGNADSKA